MTLVSADTSSLIRYLEGRDGPDVDLIQAAFDRDDFRLTPPVMAELLSWPKPRPLLEPMLAQTPVLSLDDGFWMRVGQNRRTILALGQKAKLADALIAQCCIDADVALVAHDQDFRHFAAHCGLKLVV